MKGRIMKKTVSALAILAGAVTANAAEYVCIPTELNAVKNTTSATLCDATAVNKEWAAKLNVTLDSETGCVPQSADMAGNPVNHHIFVYHAQAAAAKDAAVTLRDCTPYEAMMISTEL